MKTLLKTILVLFPLLLATYAATADAVEERFECQVTTVSADNTVRSWEQSASHAWYGTEQLAVMMPKNGHWLGMGPERNYFDKFWWWQKGYDARVESRPNLRIVATRLDKQSKHVEISNATSGYNSSGWNAMLVGMTFPDVGCWKVVGSYGEHELTIILNVGQSAN